MRDVLALLTAGVGICFLGLELVTAGLRESTSRTLRALIKGSTKTAPMCALIGVSAGALMQSTSAVVTVLGSMAAAGMIRLTEALPIVAFANVGTTALVYAGAIDIRAAVLLAVGLSGISFSLTHEFRGRAVASIVLGVALLLYGSNLVTAAASDVERARWVSALFDSWYGSTFMAFVIGTVASFLTQSTATVALITVALGNASLLEFDEAVAMMYGANLGSTLMRMLLTRRATGTVRQVARFQDLFKIAGVTLFLLLFIVEEQFRLPLVEAAVGAAIRSLPVQLATVNLLLNGSIACAATLLASPIERFLVARWPPTRADELSAPKYVTPDSLADPATAIDLVEKEQMRILKATRDYLAFVRPHVAPDVHPAPLHRSFETLFRQMAQCYATLVGKPIDSTTSSRLANVHARQELIELVEDSLFQLATSADPMTPSGKLAPLIENFAEALDFLLMFAGDAARTLDRDRAQFVFDLSSDRGDMMAGIRALYLAPDQALTADEKALLLRLTNLFERVVWMLQRYAVCCSRTSIHPHNRALAPRAPQRERRESLRRTRDRNTQAIECRIRRHRNRDVDRDDDRAGSGAVQADPDSARRSIGAWPRGRSGDGGDSARRGGGTAHASRRGSRIRHRWPGGARNRWTAGENAADRRRLHRAGGTDPQRDQSRQRRRQNPRDLHRRKRQTDGDAGSVAAARQACSA